MGSFIINALLTTRLEDTRLSSQYKNKIGPIEISFCCPLTLLSLCSVGCLSLAFLNWDSQRGRDLAMSGGNKQKFQLCQSYSYIIRKVWYPQIWIQNNLGFMVLILIQIPRGTFVQSYNITTKFRPSKLLSTNDNRALNFQLICCSVNACLKYFYFTVVHSYACATEGT